MQAQASGALRHEVIASGRRLPASLSIAHRPVLRRPTSPSVSVVAHDDGRFQNAPKPWERDDLRRRCQLIESSGPEVGDELLDPAPVFEWVRNGLSLDLADAMRAAVESRDRREITIVYFIRQRLALTRAMAASPAVTVPEDLAEWYQHVDDLRPRNKPDDA